jgi:hypothetical protein
MKPLIHSKSSVKKYGGVVEDYMKIHEFMDSTKSAMADIRHRAILHSAFGIYLVQEVFGTHFKNSQGKDVSVRDVAEDHVIEDLGFIPSMENYLKNMEIQPWMSGTLRKNRKRSYEKLGRGVETQNTIEEVMDATGSE